MPLQVADVPTEVIDTALRAFLADARIPGQDKPTKDRTLSDQVLLSRIRGCGRGGFTTRVDAGGRGWTVSITQHRLRIWIDADWNTDPPLLQGPDVLAHVRRIFDLPRPEDDAGYVFD